MEQEVIQEPQLSYLLELFTELGSAADDFVLAGAQAIRLRGITTRFTKDFDFILNVIALRKITQSIYNILQKLRYEVDPNARNFQFYKQIPNSQEKMRIEFLASGKDKRTSNIRVNVQEKIHARACVGAEIALKESDYMTIKGILPDGKPTEVKFRVIRSHALLMLKLFAMDDRYKNVRGPKEAEHDRNEARIHTADIVSIVNDNIRDPNFCKLFWSQFGVEVELKDRSLGIISEYFADLHSPGIQLYREFLSEQKIGIDYADYLNRALREVRLLLSGLVSS